MSDEQAIALRTKMLGATLREARENSGKSIRESADLLGVSSSTFSSYEHGRKGISLPELEILAYAYRVPLRTFWTDTADERADRKPFNAKQEIQLRQRLIGARLRKHRHDADSSIAGLAEEVGFPASRISAYERGQRSIPLPELEVLARALGRDVDEYVELDGLIGEWIKQRRLFEGFRNLPEDLQEFTADPEKRSFIRVAKDLSNLDVEEMRSLLRSLQEITP